MTVNWLWCWTLHDFFPYASEFHNSEAGFSWKRPIIILDIPNTPHEYTKICTLNFENMLSSVLPETSWYQDTLTMSHAAPSHSLVNRYFCYAAEFLLSSVKFASFEYILEVSWPPTPKEMLELGHGRVFCEKFRSFYVVKLAHISVI